MIKKKSSKILRLGANYAVNGPIKRVLVACTQAYRRENGKLHFNSALATYMPFKGFVCFSLRSSDILDIKVFIICYASHYWSVRTRLMAMILII